MSNISRFQGTITTMNPIYTFLVAFTRPIARSNELSVFGDLPFTDHIARRKKQPERTFARRLQLAVKGKIVDVLGVKPGNYAIIDGDDATELGKDIDVIPLAYLDKAVDASGDDVEVAFGLGNEKYQRIAKRQEAHGFQSGCMTGPVFLLFERSTGDFLELYCNNASMIREASILFDSLPVTKSQAEAHGIEARAPQPVSLGSKYLNKGKYPRQVPVWSKSKAKFENLPSAEEFKASVLKFLKQAEFEADDHER